MTEILPGSGEEDKPCEETFDLNKFFSLEEMIKRKRESLEQAGDWIEARGREMEAIKTQCGLPEKGSLYYPACGFDYSPSLAFPGWDAVYLDPVLDPVDFASRGGEYRLISQKEILPTRLLMRMCVLVSRF